MEKLRKTFVILLSFLMASFILSSILGQGEISSSDIAIIKVRGLLTVDKNPSYKTDFSSSTDLVNALRNIDKDPLVKAIILDVNSPGGTPVATDEIASAIKYINKPTVAVIREVGASGGYWIASACDHVLANRMSITGSIGATMSYLDFSGLIERYNVSYERLVSGEFKDMGTPLRELRKEEREIFLDTLDDLEDIFVKEVAYNRGLPVGKVEELADGRIYLGLQAKEHGLIDDFGSIDEALIYLEKTHNITGDYMVYKSQRGVFSDFLPGFTLELEGIESLGIRT